MKFLFLLLLSLQFLVLSAQEHYKIYAVKFAERTKKIPVSTRAIGDVTGDSTGVYYMFWVLQSKNKTILVDAGFSDPTGYEDMKFTRPDSALQKLNIKAEDISDIILTHPHWDHVNGIDLFPNAMVWMQKKDHDEFMKFIKEKGDVNFGFTKKDADKLAKKKAENKLTLVKGDDKEILPGIRVYTGSKHTFESQYIALGPDEDRTIIASDNCWFYYNLTSMFPSLSMDPKAYVKNLMRMRMMVKDIKFIIPGHDPLVFKKFPEVTENIVLIRD